MFLRWIFLALLSIASICHAEESFAHEQGYLTSYKEAHAKALAEHKPLMILFVTTSCPWCQKLKHQTLKKDDVSTVVQRSFVPVLLDKETDTFPKAFMPPVVPTIVFVAPNKEEKFFEILGYKPMEEFLELIKEAKTTYKAMQP